MSGALIVLLGVWGALIPFVGPYFHYAYGGFHTWHYTTQRLWLNIVPGAVAVIGGLMLLSARTRVAGLVAGWVAVAAGIWYAVGPSVSLIWHHSMYPIGIPAGGYIRQMVEWIGYFYGLGAAIIGLAAFAMGRYFSRPRVADEAAVAAAAAAPAARRRPVNAPPAAGREPVAAEREPVAGEQAAPAAAEPAPAASTASTQTARPRRRFGLFGRRRAAAPPDDTAV